MGAAAPVGAVPDDKWLVLEQMDRDRDGMVDREEYLLAARDALDHHNRRDKAFRRNVYKSLGNLYDICDLDDDGLLNAREIRLVEYLSNMAANDAVRRQQEGLPPVDEEEFGLALAADLLWKFDQNGDKQVSYDEFASGFKSAHASIQRMVPKVFDEADILRDGVLSLRELQFGVFLLNEFSLDDMRRSMFRDLDLDKDSRISREELDVGVRFARSKLRRGQQSVAELMADNFSDADRNRDGVVDWDEAKFLAFKMMRYLASM